jgi:hypothetical protein
MANYPRFLKIADTNIAVGDVSCQNAICSYFDLSLSVKIPLAIVAAITALGLSAHAEPAPLPAGVSRVAVAFSGGHETEGQDRGRPVILIAGALGVAPEVFREAFSQVHPAGPGKEPEPEEVRKNKAALMSALGKYGIDNDRLDAVSNYYRYVRSRGDLWPTQPAVANALVKNGVVTGFEVVNGGSGYSSVPTVTVPKIEGVKARVELSYGKDFPTNGSVSAIKLATDQAK